MGHSYILFIGISSLDWSQLLKENTFLPIEQILSRADPVWNEKQTGSHVHVSYFPFVKMAEKDGFIPKHLHVHF